MTTTQKPGCSRKQAPRSIFRSAACLRAGLGFCCLNILAVGFFALGQFPPVQHFSSQDNALQLDQELLDLTTSYRLMGVGAHPDDEDDETLTYYRQRYGISTTLITSSFGEGGQNAIGPELYTELAVIRSHELRRAGEIYGVTLENLKFVDFGFSKTAAETFEKWGGRDKLVGELVRVIRKYRPHVIITNHDTGSGHGNHQAVGQAVIEAVKIAGDPQAFPSQLRQGVAAWTPQRLLRRVSARQRSSGATGGVLENPVGQLHPLRGISYAEIGNRGYQQHVSQGPWPAYNVSAQKTYYQFVAGPAPLPPAARNLFDGLAPAVAPELRQIESTLRRRAETWRKNGTASRQQLLAGLAVDLRAVEQMLNTAEKAGFSAAKKSAIVDDLASWQRRLQHTCSVAAGQRISVDVAPLAREAVSGYQPSDFTKLVQNRPRNEVVAGSAAAVRVVATHLLENQSQFQLQLPSGWKLLRQLDDPSQTDSVYKAVHFLIAVDPGAEINLPATEALYRDSYLKPQVRIEMNLQSQAVRWKDRLSFFVYVRPPVEAVLIPEAQLILKEQLPAKFQAHVRLTRYAPDPTSVDFRITVPSWAEVTPQQGQIRDLEVRSPMFVRIAGRVASAPAPVTLDLEIDAQGTRRNDSARLHVMDLRRPLVRSVALVPGFEDSIEEGLRQLGVSFKKLSEAETLSADLTRYDVVLIDSRAYILNPALVANNSRFLDYVRDGGHMVVFYQRAHEFNAAAGFPDLAPYPLELSSRRVSVEESPVHILAPDHPLLKSPHAIGPGDFLGWVQERGLYFPGKWDSNYQALLATSDPGEGRLEGGLLVARYGKGTYIYTTYAWHRQVRAFHAGGYRMLVNLIDYGLRVSSSKSQVPQSY